MFSVKPVDLLVHPGDSYLTETNYVSKNSMRFKKFKEQSIRDTCFLETEMFPCAAYLNSSPQSFLLIQTINQNAPQYFYEFYGNE